VLVRSKKLILGLILSLSFLAAQQADADAWCNTRNKCRWYSKKFTANAMVGCIGFSLPLCYQHSGDCDYTANLSCGWRNCLWGGGDAQAHNGWNGCYKWYTRSGQGVAGDPTVTGTRDDDQGSGDVVSHAKFDDLTKTVNILLERGEITALAGGMAGRLDAYIFRDDTDESQIKEGEEAPEPEPTPANTLWHGTVVLRDGAVAVTGFDPRGFIVTTDANVETAQRLNVTDAAFANLVVRVSISEE
jgi:hypothetical protein